MQVKVIIGSTNLPRLYDCVAIAMGLNLDNIMSYDCKKIEVSTAIMHKIMDWYKANYDDYKTQFAMEWICFGPKENKSLPDDAVEIQEGFVKFREVENGKKKSV